MSRYIDAEILRERLIKNIALTNALDVSFSEAPTIDIVWCKDCKYSQFKDNGVLRPTGYCHRLNMIISGKGKGYCYLAERKDGKEE